MRTGRCRTGWCAVCSLVRMPLVVQKFGETSVGDADRIRAVVDYIARTRRQGTDVVAVVSAMGKTTDDLIHLANSVSTTQPPREYDMLVSTGERISMSLLVMALADLGVDASSFTGSQVGIITDDDHTRAKIREVKGDRLRDRRPGRREGPGCGGASRGSPRPARSRCSDGADPMPPRSRWLAAVLDADACEIYTDVTGVFTGAPEDRARGAPHQPDLIRGDARDGSHRWAGAHVARGRVRGGITMSHCM